jgi:hypothetical protein
MTRIFGVVIGIALGGLMVLDGWACGPRHGATPPDERNAKLQLSPTCPFLVPSACCDGPVCELGGEADFGNVINCADGPPPPPPACPCLQGFDRVGPRGRKCTIDGPGFDGDGTSETLENSCHRLELKIKTGYIDATFTITRSEAAPCQDTLAVKGKLYNTKTEQMEDKDVSSRATINYDCSTKRGTMTTPDGHGGTARYPYHTDSDDQFVIELNTYEHEFEDCK